VALLRPSDEVVLTELKDGTGVLLHLRTKFYYALNRTGVAVWKLMAAGQGGSVAVVAGRIAEQFRDVPPDAVERDVAALLTDLEAEGLLLPPERGAPPGA